MPEDVPPLIQLLRDDPRYPLEAYQFVRDALTYAQEVMGLGRATSPETADERHLTGQQLCEASRRYALQQYGLMARVVLKNWGIQSTSDLGEIVYNLIRANLMKKSDDDRREDFDDVFDFETAFDQQFTFGSPGRRAP
jgi:uncharacterized repeat protein (TIGR04138 family)